MFTGIDERRHRVSIVSLLATGLLLVAGGAATAATPDLSGFWDLSVDSRQVPAADLLPGVTPAAVATHAKADAREVRYCVFLGMPYLMDSGRPLNIQQGSHVILMYTQAQVAPRYVYLDRNRHISADEYDPTTNGDSIGHWEGDTLVVDTVGFAGNRGITAIPGGGFRTDKSHLVERYHLLEGGAVLSVVSTWTDPGVFARPHTYEFRYYRLPKSFEPTLKDPCDAFDATRTAFLEGSKDAAHAASGQ
jgi:hypothetical protein